MIKYRFLKKVLLASPIMWCSVTIGAESGLLNYTLSTNGVVRVSGGIQTESREITVETDSFLTGYTVSVSAFDVNYCRFGISYPSDPSLRSAFQNSQTIELVYLGAPVDHMNAKLPNLFVRAGTALRLSFVSNGGANANCDFRAHIHFQPLPIPKQPQNIGLGTR